VISLTLEASLSLVDPAIDLQQVHSFPLPSGSPQFLDLSGSGRFFHYLRFVTTPSAAKQSSNSFSRENLGSLFSSFFFPVASPQAISVFRHFLCAYRISIHVSKGLW